MPAAAFAVTGWLVVRKTFTPIVSLNDQLDGIGPNNFQVQIRIETDESELRELQEHINGLLSRISLTFHQLQSYSAQVAHELRAPLTIIRLKIEEAADKIEPSLAEEIQTASIHSGVPLDPDHGASASPRRNERDSDENQRFR